MTNHLIKLHRKEEGEYYHRWSQVWRHEKRIQIAVSLLPRYGKILDIGSRFGDITNEIYKRNKDVTGLEFVPEFVSFAKQKYPYITFYHGDALNIPFFDNTFEIVHCGETIEHIIDQDKVMSEIYRILKPNGILVLTTPNLTSLRRRLKLLLGQRPDTDKVHFTVLTEQELKHLLIKNRFKIINFKYDGIKLSNFKFPMIKKSLCDIFVVRARKIG